MNAKSKTIIIILAIIIFLGLIIIASVFFQNKYVSNTYNNALSLIDNDSFTEAKTELEKIDDMDYKDISDLIKLCDAHISYDNGSSGAYMLIDDLSFEYQSKEQLEKINAFIEESKKAYKEFYDKLVEESKANNSNNSADKRSSYSPFTNKYGTSTTKCAHSGCTNYIASSGDTNCCTVHSSRCIECGCYIDEDANWCMDCIKGALK